MHAAETGTPNSGIRCPIKRIRRLFFCFFFHFFFFFWAVGEKSRRQVRQPYWRLRNGCRREGWGAIRPVKRGGGEERGQPSPATRVPWHGDFYGVTLLPESSSPGESSAYSRLVARKKRRCDLHTQIRHGSRKCACYDAVLWGARIDITRIHELRIGVRRPALRRAARTNYRTVLLYLRLTAGAGRNREISR